MELTDRPPAELSRALSRGLAVRRVNFADKIAFSAPSFKHFRNEELRASGEPRFAALSVTGRACQLGCEHCRGVLLHSMAPVESPEALMTRAKELHRRGGRGFLLSGGCDSTGSVPLGPFVEAIGEVRRTLGMTVAVHTGLADAPLAQGLAAAGVERVMIDVVGDADTIGEVLHLDAGPERFEASMAALTDAGLAVVPHLVAGLHFGELRGEERALELITKYPVAAAVLVVARPEPDTPFADVTPPAPEEVAALMLKARLRLPATPLFLGCARPVGQISRSLERYAVRAGFNGVAFPADETVRLARSLGLEATFAEQCCAM